MISLDKVAIGKNAVIEYINHPFLTSRLKEMGLIEGKEVKVLFKAAFNGPLALEMGGWVLSMRCEEASHIQIHE